MAGQAVLQIIDSQKC